MRRILVLRGGALGDFIVTLPALALLRQRWPAAEIELIGNAPAAALARSRGLLTTVHSQHERRWSALYGKEALPPALAAWLATFDLVLNYWPDPDRELRRHFPLHPAQCYLSAPARPEHQPAAAHYCAPLLALGLETRDFLFTLVRPEPFPNSSPEQPGGAASSPPAEFGSAPEHHCQRETLSFRLDAPHTAARPLIIHPGSGSPQKNWPAERWLALLREIAIPVELVLGEAEIAQWQNVSLPGITRVTNAPLEELIARFARCRFFLGHDSGISHLAAACGAACLLLFGPTDPAMWAPPGPRVQTMRRGSSLDTIAVEDVRSALAAALSGRR
jgi:ADP-heptose:LPS heptosyltransferase